MTPKPKPNPTFTERMKGSLLEGLSFGVGMAMGRLASEVFPPRRRHPAQHVLKGGALFMAAELMRAQLDGELDAPSQVLAALDLIHAWASSDPEDPEEPEGNDEEVAVDR